MTTYSDEMRAQYAAQWKSMLITPSRREAVDAIARKLCKNKARYQAVSAKTGVPWFVIAVLHERESDADFTTHLHNGDSLQARTHHVPAGRPPTGNPPFTWEESAIDALTYNGLSKVTDWSIEDVAYQCEGYNGWGYHSHGVPSAYLWSFSNIYKGGKFVADGVWSSSAMDAQCGVMPMLYALSMLDQLVAFGDKPKPAPIPPPPDIAPPPTPVPNPPWWRVFLSRFLQWRKP